MVTINNLFMTYLMSKTTVFFQANNAKSFAVCADVAWPKSFTAFCVALCYPSLQATGSRQSSSKWNGEPASFKGAGVLPGLIPGAKDRFAMDIRTETGAQRMLVSMLHYVVVKFFCLFVLVGWFWVWLVGWLLFSFGSGPCWHSGLTLTNWVFLS